MAIYLGLDLGGTRSRWAWSDREVHEAPGGIQVAAQGIEKASGKLAQLLAEIWSACPDRTPDMTVIGMAGAGDPAIAEEVGARITRSGLNWPLVVVADVVVSAAAALGGGPGVVIWSGTGSFAVARDEAGRLHRVGGRGHLVGDEGSAYDIVRRAALAVVRALDGIGPKTELTGVMVQAFDCGSPASLGRAMQSCTPAEVASRCPVIVDCAEEGDGVAAKVLRSAAVPLAAQARTAARRAGLDLEEAKLFAGGGALEPDSGYKDMLADVLREAGFARDPETMSGGAANGAVALAEALHKQLAPMCDWVKRVGTP